MKLTRGYHFCVAQDHVKNLLNSEKELRLVKFETRAIYFYLFARDAEEKRSGEPLHIYQQFQ